MCCQVLCMTSLPIFSIALCTRIVLRYSRLWWCKWRVPSSGGFLLWVNYMMVISIPWRNWLGPLYTSKICFTPKFLQIPTTDKQIPKVLSLPYANMLLAYEQNFVRDAVMGEKIEEIVQWYEMRYSVFQDRKIRRVISPLWKEWSWRERLIWSIYASQRFSKTIPLINLRKPIKR